MIYELMQNVNNYFDIDGMEQSGNWKIEDGEMECPFLKEGQFYIVEGSVFNDGLHQYKDNDLTDEEFKGNIRPLAVPKAFIALAEEIKAWKDRYGEAASSPFLSESFGGYSYNKGTAASTTDTSTWQSQFKKQLHAWRLV